MTGPGAVTLSDEQLGRICDLAEPLFAQAVAQGAPFALNTDYWGRDYAARLFTDLVDAGFCAEEGGP